VSTWDRNRQQTAELQAVFTGERLEGVAGVFALDGSAETVLGAVLGTTGDLIGRPGLGNELYADVGTRSWAVFADASYALSERWSTGLGVRYTHDERSSLVQRRVLVGGVSSFFGGTGTTVSTTSDFRGKEVFEKVTPRAVVQWRPLEDQQVYLSYSEGFKGGGFDPRGLSSQAPDIDRDGEVSAGEVHEFMKFDPEEVDSWELGWKAILFGGHVSSRFAVFVADYTDMQIPGAIAVDENGDGVADTWVGITTNAGRSRMDGFEWECRALVAESLGIPGARLELSWAVGHIDAQFLEFIDEEGNDVAHERVFENTPQWTAAVSADYGLPVTWLGHAGQFTAITTWSWRDDHFQFTRPIPEFDQSSFALWDLSLIWLRNDERWRLGLHGKNLTDERYKVAGLDITLGLEDNYTVYYGNPRQYWLDLQYRFH